MDQEIEKKDNDIKKNVLMSKNTFELNEKLFVQHLGPNRTMFDMHGTFSKAKKIYFDFYNFTMGH